MQTFLFTRYWVSERVPWSYCTVEYSGNTLAFEIPWPLLDCVTFSVLWSCIPPQWAQVTEIPYCTPFAQENGSGWASLQMGQWWGGLGLPCFVMPSSGVNWEYGNEFNKTSTDFFLLFWGKRLFADPDVLFVQPIPFLSQWEGQCSCFVLSVLIWICRDSYMKFLVVPLLSGLLCTFACDAMPCSFQKNPKKLFYFVRAGNVDLSRNNR